MVDGLFVSNVVGETAFAAINLIFPYCMVFSSLGTVFGVGGSALVAKIKGEGDDDKANKVFSMLVAAMFVLGLVFTGVSLVLLPHAAKLMGASGALMDGCLSYARIFLITQSAFFLQYGMQTLMITAERPKLGLAFTVGAGVTNMVLDWLFIAILGWGVAGAAAASCIGQVIGGFGPVAYFALSKTTPLKLVKTSFMPRELLKSASNGAAEGITNAAMSFVSMVFNFQLMKYLGEYGVSAYGVILYVNFVFLAVFIGYSMGISPVFSYNLGSGNDAELRSLFKKSVTVIALISVAVTVAAFAGAKGIAAVFAGYDQKFLEVTVRALQLYSVCYLFAGINIFGSNLFAALNDGLTAGILSGLRMFVFQIIPVLTLPLIFGSDGIWLSMFVAEFCVFLITVVVLMKKKNTYHYM